MSWPTKQSEEKMELEVLKKKLSAFKGDGGRIRNVNDELLLEILSHWEYWAGTAKDFYKGIGSSEKGISFMLGKAKRLKRAGATLPFTEVQVEEVTNSNFPVSITCNIEVQDKNKLIRFRKVDHLIEYLKKAA